MHELPAAKRHRYLTELNLKITDIDIILQDYDLMTFLKQQLS